MLKELIFCTTINKSKPCIVCILFSFLHCAVFQKLHATVENTNTALYWEPCIGQCGGKTEQVRKRSVCVETSKIQPFTVENVIAFCKFTEPLSEKKVCPQCPHGIFNATTGVCDYCSKYEG